MKNRHRAREIALQALYLRDVNPETSEQSLRQFVHDRLAYAALEAFCWLLIRGVIDHLDEIDHALAGVSENWSVGRMSLVDRNILRMGVYQLRYSTDVPPKVAINEAIELAKRFSTADAPAFVNGVLDRCAGLWKPEAETVSAMETSHPTAPRSADVKSIDATVLQEEP